MQVTHHAAQRWCERVNPALTLDQATAAIAQHDRAVSKAAAFGCKVVRLPSHHKLILEGDSVVTVLPADAPWTGHIKRKAS